MFQAEEAAEQRLGGEDVPTKMPSTGPQHLCKKCKAGEAPRQTGLGTDCETDELGRVSPGSCIIY